MIIAALLEQTWEKALEKIKFFEPFAEQIQIDFADGKLVDGKTFLEIEKLNELQTSMKVELHFMVENPTDFLQQLPNVVKVCAQIEAQADLNKFLDKAKALGYKTGLSVAPNTDYDKLKPYINKLDFVQFMTIIPGSQGQDLIKSTLPKILSFRKQNPHIKIQVDGGVKTSNIKSLLDVGVNDFVVGSELIKSSNPKQMYVQLNEMTAQQTISSLREKKIQKVAILGGAAWSENEEPYKQAFEVSKILAENGYEIINGGGPGVMRASTKGGHAGGGRVLAITYHPNKPKRHYEGVDPQNDFDDEIITLDYFDRTKVMLQTTQLHIIFKGSLGTLSELGMSWISSWIHEPNNKPIILYGDFWNDYLKVIDAHAKIDDAEKAIVKICTTPQQVLDYVKTFE